MTKSKEQIDIAKSVDSDAQSEEQKAAARELKAKKAQANRTAELSHNVHVIDAPKRCVYDARDKQGIKQIMLSIPDADAPKGKGFGPSAGALFVDKSCLVEERGNNGVWIDLSKSENPIIYQQHRGEKGTFKGRTKPVEVSVEQAVDIARIAFGKNPTFNVELPQEGSKSASKAQKAVKATQTKEASEKASEKSVEPKKPRARKGDREAQIDEFISESVKGFKEKRGSLQMDYTADEKTSSPQPVREQIDVPDDLNIDVDFDFSDDMMM